MKALAVRVVALAALNALVAPPAPAADILRGQTLYQAHCTSCHGRGGLPPMPGAPSLARPEVMMRADAVLLAVLRNGRGTMPGFRGQLQDRDLLDVIAYARTLQR